MIAGDILKRLKGSRGNLNILGMRSLIVLILCWLCTVLFQSCSDDFNSQIVINESNDSTVEYRSQQDYVFTKIPHYDSLSEQVSMMEYQVINNVKNKIYSQSYDIEDLLEYLWQKDEFEYKWKILEDVKNFEMVEYNHTQVDALIQEKIDSTNSAMWEADAYDRPEGCDQIITAGNGPNAGLMYLEMRLEEDPWLFFGGRDCVEDRPQFDAWLELYEFQVPQDIEDDLPGNYEIQDFGDPFIQWVPVNLDNYWVDMCELTEANVPPFYYLSARTDIGDLSIPCNSDFILHPNFTQDDWIDNPEGVIFNIDIPMDNGDVVCSDEYWGDDLVDLHYYGYYWRFSTLTTGSWHGGSGRHPVAGNRQFGLYRKEAETYTFYTLGVDRVNSATLLYPIVLNGGNSLWECLIQEEVGKHAAQKGIDVKEDGNTKCRPSIKEWAELWNENCNPFHMVDEWEGNCIEC